MILGLFLYAILDHSQSGVVHNFGRVCLSVIMYVCLYVCQTTTLESRVV